MSFLPFSSSETLSHLPAALVLIPLLGGLAAFRFGNRMPSIGLVCSSLVLGVVIGLLVRFPNGSQASGFSVHIPLVAGLEWPVYVDGTGILFITVTATLSFLLMLYEWVKKNESAHAWTAALLCLEALLMGLFTTHNLFSFSLLATLELIPAGYLMTARISSPAHRPTHKLYWQFMGSGLFLLWTATVLLGLHHAETRGVWSFDLELLQATPLPQTMQRMVFILLFYAAAIRLAQFPVHAWLPELTQQPRTPGFLVMMAGSKVGLYLLLCFVLPLLPDAVIHFRTLAAGLGVAGMFYGAVLALMQIKLHRLLAFALVSQTGMLLVGVFSLNAEGLAGSLLLSFNFSLAATGLFLTADIVLRRTGTLLIPRLGALFDPLPLLAITFLIAASSTMAMPGTPGFDAAHLLLEGTLETHDWAMAIAVAVGNVLSVAILLYAFQKVFMTHRRETSLRVLLIQPNLPETLLSILLCLILLGVGFYVEPWMQLINTTSHELATLYRTHTP